MTQFWENKPLSEMTHEEWEALCDGCGKCCLWKLEDEETGAIGYTDVACRYLDPERARCTDYRNRADNVPDCVTLTPQNLDKLSWMPSTCAYRRLAEGKPLPTWHPLVSGRQSSVRLSGNSVCGRCRSEADVDVQQIDEFIVDWPA